METLIPEFYKNYGVYVNTSKMLPSIIDGTIPVWRRLLLGAHTVARREFVKTATVFGHVIGHWHPHSEAIQGTAEILVQNGFLDGKGNWGTTIGIEPIGCAAPRYTGLKMNELIEEIAFKYVQDVEWIEDELDPEPLILPSMIPLCLFPKYEFNMIGFGFKTEIPNYKLSSLIYRLLYLLKKGNKVVIKPNIEGCEITSSNEVLEKLLNTPGKHTITIKGSYIEDPKNFRVYVTGWNPRSNFSNIFKKIDSYKKQNLLSRGDISFIDESTDSVGTKIRFEVSKSRNREKFYNQLVDAIKNILSATISFNIYAVASQEVVSTSVDEMLLLAYKNFTSVLERHFNKRIDEVKELISELKVIEKIKPHLHKVFSLPSIDEMISKLSTLTNIETKLIELVLSKYKIKKLMTIGTDISELNTELNSLKDNLEHVDDFAITCYKDLLKIALQNEKTEEKTKKERYEKIQRETVKR